MTTRLRQWLFRRRKQPQQRIPAPLSPYTAMITEEWRRRTVFDADMEEDPEMCDPWVSKPTQHVTRVIDQGTTVPVPRWKDDERTWTMETARIEI